MSLINDIARKLKKSPALKRMLKNIYQYVGAFLGDGKSSPEKIECVSNSAFEHLFGYYDKSPWNKSGTKMLYLRVPSANKEADSSQKAEIIVKDLVDNSENKVAVTHSWNVQQGCMLQWLGESDDVIIYNDFRDDRYCSVILDLSENSEKIIDFPVYSVSRNGEFAVSLDFSRLHSLRPGYGYCNIEDAYKKDKLPDSDCVYFVDLISGAARPIVNYKTLSELNHKDTMDEAYHKVNHIMLNPSGTRFIFMHRWILNGVKYDRLLSCDINGENMRILLDWDMVSHCNWKNDEDIIAFANYKDQGYHYYTFKDAQDIACAMVPDMPDVDGHPSYSPDGRYILTDTYPSFKRKQKLYIYDISKGELKTIANVHSNIRFINETRCDLHPRWKADSKTVCFDGAQQSRRQVYVLEIEV